MEYIDRNQLTRRNLNESGIAYTMGKIYNRSKTRGGYDRIKSKGHKLTMITAAQVSVEMGLSEKTIIRYGQYAEAVDRFISICGIEAKNEIISDKFKICRKIIEKLSKKLTDKEILTLFENLRDGKSFGSIRSGYLKTSDKKKSQVVDSKREQPDISGEENDQDLTISGEDSEKNSKH